MWLAFVKRCCRVVAIRGQSPGPSIIRSRHSSYLTHCVNISDSTYVLCLLDLAKSFENRNRAERRGTTVALVWYVRRSKWCPGAVHLTRIQIGGLKMKIEPLKRFLLDEEGQSVVEYSLLMTLIAATSVVVMTMMGLNVGRMVGQEITVESFYRWAYDKFSTAPTEN
jgi:Flp pilus assembly pilin Flp